MSKTVSKPEAPSRPIEVAVEVLVDSEPLPSHLLVSPDLLELEPTPKLEEVGFNEHTIQEYINGLAVRLAYREYQGGNSIVHLKVTPESQISKEIQLDIPGAAKLLHMLTTVLQKHYAAQELKKAVARAPNLSIYERIGPDTRFSDSHPE